MNTIRRQMLQSLGAAATLALVPRSAAAAAASTTATSAGGPSIAAFAALSATLNEYPVGDPGIAAKVRTAFATPARRAALTRLAALAANTPAPDLDGAIRAGGLDTVANELVSVWYSGVVVNAGGRKLVLYTDALVWTAMTWSKPMGVCGGPFGYWSAPPQ